MLDGRVVDHEIDDDAHAERVAVVHELDEIARGAVLGMHAVVIGDVVAVVAVGRRVERLQPQAGHAEAVKVFEAAVQAFEITDPVAVGVHVLLDVETVQDRVLVPEVLDRHAAATRCACARTR
jgi:hypothetical protein